MYRSSTDKRGSAINPYYLAQYSQYLLVFYSTIPAI